MMSPTSMEADQLSLWSNIQEMELKRAYFLALNCHKLVERWVGSFLLINLWNLFQQYAMSYVNEGCCNYSVLQRSYSLWNNSPKLSIVFVIELLRFWDYFFSLKTSLNTLVQPESIFRWHLFALIRPRLIKRLNKSFEKYYFHDGLTPVLYLN